MTIMAVLLGFAAAPVVFLWTFDHTSAFTMSQYGEKDVSSLQFCAALGSIVLSIAWSVFAFVGWKRGNIGIRIGLTVIVWAIVSGHVLAYLARVMLDTI
jgi:hypothetical protein